MAPLFSLGYIVSPLSWHGSQSLLPGTFLLGIPVMADQLYVVYGQLPAQSTGKHALVQTFSPIFPSSPLFQSHLFFLAAPLEDSDK